MIGGRDEQRLRQTVKTTEATPLRRFDQQPVPRTPLGLMGRAEHVIGGNESGIFAILGNPPDSFRVTSRRMRAYPLCAVAEGTDCALIRMSGENTGGYWIAIPCREGTPTIYPCEFAEGGEMPTQTLSITGLVDNASYPEFTGWAVKINGSHTLLNDVFNFTNSLLYDNQQAGTNTGPLTSVNVCNPGLEIAVPDNDVDKEAGGPFGVALRTNIFSPGSGLPTVLAVDVWLSFSAGKQKHPENEFFVRHYIEVIWKEGIGANRFPRDANGRGQYDQTYVDWVKPSSIGNHSPDTNWNEHFRAWLSAATITLNP